MFHVSSPLPSLPLSSWFKCRASWLHTPDRTWPGPLGRELRTRDRTGPGWSCLNTTIFIFSFWYLVWVQELLWWCPHLCFVVEGSRVSVWVRGTKSSNCCWTLLSDCWTWPDLLLPCQGRTGAGGQCSVHWHWGRARCLDVCIAQLISW